MSTRFFATVAFAALSCAAARAQSEAPSAHPIEAEEYAVLSAAVAQVPTAHPPRWILVGARTATFECDPPVANGMSMGACSGMRSVHESPEQLMVRLRAAIPAVTPDMAGELIRVSGRSETLEHTLALPYRQVLWDPTADPKATMDPGSPDFAVYVSRVGFNESRSQALVYVGVINYADASRSIGEYLLMTQASGAWRVAGRMRVWSLQDR